jgi:membrane associated rhomboid family serine protease
MLLVPIEDRGSWRRPPALIVLLLLVNLVVHIHTQISLRSAETRLDHFLAPDQLELLVEREWPLFLDWTEEDRPRVWLEVHETETGERRDVLRRRAWERADFTRHVRDHWKQHEPSEQWRRARQQLEQWRVRQPFVAHGLIPAEMDVPSWLTHMFMHGGWAHLFGNMLFLLLFGVPMERHWGARRLLPLYLVSGLGAAALFVLFNPDSDIPLVGASGAIAGLMGIYCASYGLRRIEFFYTLGFFFGSFRAPAFAVFPLWIGKEIIQSMVSTAPVAYMAHVGGLLAGAGVALLAQHYWPPPQRDGPPDDAPANAHQAHRADAVPATIERQARELNFDQALEMARRRLDEHPDWPTLWDYALELAPRGDYTRQQALLQLAIRKRHAGQLGDRDLARFWHVARQWNPQGRRLSPAAQLVLAEALARQKENEQSRALIRELDEAGWSHARLDRLRRWLDEEHSSG